MEEATLASQSHNCDKQLSQLSGRAAEGRATRKEILNPIDCSALRRYVCTVAIDNPVVLSAYTRT